MRRRTIIKSSALFGLGALTSSIISSCTQSSTTSKSLKPLRVGVIVWIGSEGMYLADKKKLFAAEGLQVDQKYFKSMTEMNTALLTRQIDVGTIVATDLVIHNAQVPNIKTIMITDYSGDLEGILASNKIAKPEDLKGKKIALPDTPYEIVFLGEFLKLGGMTQKDVQVVLMTEEEGPAAFIAGKVDAVITYDPYLTKALQQRKDAKLIFSPKNTNFVPNSIVAHGSVIEERRNDVLAYLRALDKGLKFSVANRQEADNLMSKWLEITTADLTIQRSKIYVLDIAKNKIVAFNSSNSLNVESSIRSGGKILLERGKIKSLVDPATLIDSSLIQSL
jgi:NitT/TauT family transport system substrate-binding protein